MMPGQSESAAETCDESGLPARAAGSPSGGHRWPKGDVVLRPVDAG